MVQPPPSRRAGGFEFVEVLRGFVEQPFWYRATMNTARFLHTRAEFTSDITGLKSYGWVQNIRHMELTVSVSLDKPIEDGEMCSVLLSSEFATARFSSPANKKSESTVSFQLPIPLELMPGDDQARVQIRGQYAKVDMNGFDFIAEIEDISLGGMAFVVPIPCEPFQRLSIRIPGLESALVVEVRYCLRILGTPDFFRIGIKFGELCPNARAIIHAMMMNPIQRAA